MPSSSTQSSDAIHEIVQWAETGLAWGQNIASVIPTPAYGLISPALKALIDAIAAARINKQAAADVLTKIQTLADIVGESRQEFVSCITPFSAEDQKMVHSGVPEKPSFQDPFNKFLEDLTKLEALSKDLKHWNDCYLLHIVFSSKDAKIIQTIQVGVSDATKFFEMECHVKTQEYLGVINNRVEEIRATVKREADDRILESLPHADAGYRASINAVKGGFLEGTRSMLFVELEKWIEGGLSDKPVCILSGGAGTGKSTVASELARRLDDQGKLGASFFFARGVTDLDSPRLFFPTIAYQLAHRTKGTLRQPIIDAARVHLEKGTSQAMKYEARALLHDPLKKVVDNRSPAFVVIDALDECTQEASKLMPEMLELLMAATEHRSLCIFLTFRPDQRLESNVQSSPWANIIHTISSDTFLDNSGHDVAAFIKSRFHKINQGPELLRNCPEVADKLADRAQGLFIYAQTAMDFLADHPRSLEGGVNALLSGENGVGLRALDQLYLTVLANAFPPEHLEDVTLRAHVQLILACMAHPLNPMTPRMLESLLSLTRTPITCQDTDSVLDHLRSIIVFERGKPDHVFYPMHATFPQFLVHDVRCKNELYLVQPSRHHAHLAEACLRTVLSLDESMCKLDLPALPPLPTKNPPDTQLIDRIFPTLWARRERMKFGIALRHMLIPKHMPMHVRYACMSWAAHLREACKPEEHQGKNSECFCRNLVELLERLIRDSDNLKRLEIINLMEETGCTLEADLDYALNWLSLDQTQYDTLRSQLKNVAEGDLGASVSHTEDVKSTIGRGFPRYIYKVISLVDIATLPLPADLATAGHT